jgi:hypothetical protein
MTRVCDRADALNEAETKAAARNIHPPVEIEVAFKSRRFTARIDSDGMIQLNGANYGSLSNADGMVRYEVNGLPPGRQPYWSNNGWKSWHFKGPTQWTAAAADELAGTPLGKQAVRLISELSRERLAPIWNGLLRANDFRRCVEHRTGLSGVVGLAAPGADRPAVT